ncbi:MAG: hypothetical protein E5Y01_25710 [Mesorhizobium sp.]|nr:MAG: hypothetical protein E5Y01_25710 [Mesorhizobium sp.]
MRRWRDSAPLCPAGHLPHLGGDRTSPRLSPIANVVGRAGRRNRQSPPLGGEMSGRTEGGAKDRYEA